MIKLLNDGCIIFLSVPVFFSGPSTKRKRMKKRAQKREREKNEKKRADKSEDGKLNI